MSGEGAAELREVLARTPPRVFAVVDGAFHDDLPDALGAAGLASRALYSGTLEQAGPHLVALDDAAARERLEAVPGAAAVAVYWSWPGAEEALFAHLRRLGRIEVPRTEAHESGEAFERVLFRHADPASLLRVLPVLDDGQRAAFFGEARGIVFLHRDRRGCSRIVRVPRDGRILLGAG